RQAVRAYTERGEHLPAHSSATGKAILAASDDAVVDRFLSKPLQAFTPNTIVEPDAFRRELKSIRRRGYSVNRGERRIDVSAVGAVVRNETGEPIAGIGVSAPNQRFRADVITEVAEMVVAAAE